MVHVYNTRSVQTMDQKIKDQIINAGVPLNFYTTGILNIGANNRSALGRLASIGSLITKHKLPLPPSLFTEFVAAATSGKSKRDYRITLDGEPGGGKSYTSTYFGGRYGIEMADLHGQDPKDYFTLDNCALLQDTEGVTKLIDECDKYQCVIVDDAGIAAGNRDFLTQSNKNMSAILQVCRTKRWFLIYNMPNRRHVDLQIRELVYAKGYIYKSFHSMDFNVVKINREEINTTSAKAIDMKRRLSFGGRKLSFYLSYHTDMLDPYVGLIEKYDVMRDAATDSLIHERACQEKSNNNPIGKVESKWQEKMDKHYQTVASAVAAGNGKVVRSKLAAKTGLTDRDLLRMLSIYNNGGVQ